VKLWHHITEFKFSQSRLMAECTACFE